MCVSARAGARAREEQSVGMSAYMCGIVQANLQENDENQILLHVT